MVLLWHPSKVLHFQVPKMVPKILQKCGGEGGGMVGPKNEKKRRKKTLGGGFKYFLFSPRKLGKISNLTNIFQVG